MPSRQIEHLPPAPRRAAGYLPPRLVAYGVALTILIAAFGAPLDAGSSSLRLVRDLEDDRPMRPVYEGWAWELAQGTVVIGGTTLWRVGSRGSAPVPLLRTVVSHQVYDLTDGELILSGRSLDGEHGLWITDGGPPRRLAAAGWRGFAPMARRGAVVLGKSLFGPYGGFLWRLSEGTEPEQLGPADFFGTIIDPSGIFSCTGVVATPKGFVTCGSSGDQGVSLRFSDGSPGGTTVALQWPYFFDQPGVEWNGIRYLAARRPGWVPIVLRTDGTAAGTAVVDDEAGAPFVLWDEVAWFRFTETGWILVAGDGSSPPRVLAEVPFEPAGLAVAGDYLYLLAHHSYFPESVVSVWTLSRDGDFVKRGEVPGYSPRVAPEGRGSEVVILVGTPMGPALWLADAASSRLELVAEAGAAVGGVVQAHSDGALVPWRDPEAFARPARVDADGTISPEEILVLDGTADSTHRVVGELAGRAVLLARTAEEGVGFWISDATSTGTSSLGIPSRCLSAYGSLPSLTDRDVLVDCRDREGRFLVWIFEGDTIRSFELETTAHDPRVARTGAKLVYTRAPVGVVGVDLTTQEQTLLIAGCRSNPVPVRGDRALVHCGSQVWSTDGTQAGTSVLFEVPAPLPGGNRLIEAGGVAIAPGPISWISDGTPEGTAALPVGLFGVAPAGPEATWTCAWDGSGILRLELDGTAPTRLADLELTGAAVVPSSDDAVRVLRVGDAPPQSRLWRCDGTIAGTRGIPLAADSSKESVGFVSMANDRDSLWRHALVPPRERLERLSLERGSWETVIDRLQPLGDSLFATPLVAAAGHLWVSLADDAHGREPWVISPPEAPVFADGFESGDSSAWSASAP